LSNIAYSLVIDCFVTEMFPIAILSKEQFVDTDMSRIFPNSRHEPHKFDTFGSRLSDGEL